jgi:hypothetical protein
MRENMHPPLYGKYEEPKGKKAMDTTMTIETVVEAEKGLDAIELAALRKANTVSFHHLAPDDTGYVPRSFIRASKRMEQSASNPFGPTEVSVEIPVDWRLADYSRGEKVPYGTGEFRAFHMIGSCQFHEEWMTVVSLLRVGDILRLLWSRGGFTTEGMREAAPAFYGDGLSMEVIRDKRRLVFHVGEQVSEDNTARMVQRRLTKAIDVN